MSELPSSGDAFDQPSRRDIQQITDLLLNSPATDEPMYICSSLTIDEHCDNPLSDGFGFDVKTYTNAETYRITIKIEEI